MPSKSVKDNMIDMYIAGVWPLHDLSRGNLEETSNMNDSWGDSINRG